MEFILPLPSICGFLGGDGGSPEGAFVDCLTRGVGAFLRVGDYGWIPLQVHVECHTAGILVTEAGTIVRFVVIHSPKTHVH